MCWSKWAAMFEHSFESPSFTHIRLIPGHGWWILLSPYLGLPIVCLFKWAVKWSYWIRIWHPSPLGVINRDWSQNVLVGLIKNSLWNCVPFQLRDGPKNTLPQTASGGCRLEQQRELSVPLSSQSLGGKSPHPTACENMFGMRRFGVWVLSQLSRLSVQKNSVPSHSRFAFSLPFLISLSTGHTHPDYASLQPSGIGRPSQLPTTKTTLVSLSQREPLTDFSLIESWSIRQVWFVAHVESLFPPNFFMTVKFAVINPQGQRVHGRGQQWASSWG